MWNESFQFDIHIPELVMVRFVVEDYDSTSQNDLVAHYCLPLTSIQNGKEAPVLAKHTSEALGRFVGPSANHMTSISDPFLLFPRVSPRSAAHQERRRHLLGRPLCSPHAPRRRIITLGGWGGTSPEAAQSAEGLEVFLFFFASLAAE